MRDTHLLATGPARKGLLLSGAFTLPSQDDMIAIMINTYLPGRLHTLKETEKAANVGNQKADPEVPVVVFFYISHLQHNPFPISKAA